MKKKQLILIIFITATLILTLLVGAITYYFSSSPEVVDAYVQTDDDTNEDKLRDMLKSLSVKRTGEQADREVRGVWISSVFNIDFPSRAGLGEAQLKEE